MKVVITMCLLMCVAAAPATQPTSAPSVESDLRRIIAGLQRQIVELKKQNAALEREVASLRERLPKEVKRANVNPEDPSIADHIKVGMTWDEVVAILKAGPDRMTKESDGDEVATWEITRLDPPIPGVVGSGGRTTVGRLTVYFRDGVVTRSVFSR